MDITDITPLDETRQFIGSIIYAKPEELDLITLAIAVTHVSEQFRTLPRILITAEQGGTGKTAVLDCVKLLGRNVEPANGTGPAIKNLFKGRDGSDPLTLLRDEIHHDFGKTGMNRPDKELYDVLLRGYRKGETSNFGNQNTTVKPEITNVAFMAGLGVRPIADDLYTRTIQVTMHMKPERLPVRMISSESEEAEARAVGVRDALHAWARSIAKDAKRIARDEIHSSLHPKLANRSAQIWGPILAVAKAAGDGWLRRGLMAFNAIALDGSDRPVLTGRQQLVMDVAEYFKVTGGDFATSKDIAAFLHETNPDRYDDFGPQAMFNFMKDTFGPTSVRRNPESGETERGRYSDEVTELAKSIEAKLLPNETEGRELEEWETEML